MYISKKQFSENLKKLSGKLFPKIISKLLDTDFIKMFPKTLKYYIYEGGNDWIGVDTDKLDTLYPNETDIEAAKEVWIQKIPSNQKELFNEFYMVLTDNNGTIDNMVEKIINLIFNNVEERLQHIFNNVDTPLQLHFLPDNYWGVNLDQLKIVANWHKTISINNINDIIFNNPAFIEKLYTNYINLVAQNKGKNFEHNIEKILLQEKWLKYIMERSELLNKIEIDTGLIGDAIIKIINYNTKDYFWFNTIVSIIPEFWKLYKENKMENIT